MEQVSVIGAGSWGTAQAVLLVRKGLPVRMWTIEAEVIEEINNCRTNKAYLPGVHIPEGITVYQDIADALNGSAAVVMSVPSQAFRETLRKVVPFLNRDQVVINTAKGIEEASLKRLSEVYTEETPVELHRNIVVLSGPSHAEEVSRDIPTTVVVAGKNREVCERVQDLFMTSRFRVYTNPDIIGVEIGGALKNVIAICTGVSDGLGFGDNTKAALMTRGLAEISRLGVTLGANPLTFAGLAGVGDLIVTCTSMHSRNRRFGIEIGQGRTVEQALAAVRMVVEGYRTTGAAYRLMRQTGVEMPIIEQAHAVLYENANTVESVGKLMLRGKKHELEEVISTSYPEWEVSRNE